MKRKGKESKVNLLLSALLVVFVCLLTFSIGVITGKGWSDRDYKVKHIESDNHLKQAMNDTAPIGDDMTEKEVELLTEKALEEARAEAPAPTVDEEPKKPLGSDASNAANENIKTQPSDAKVAATGSKSPASTTPTKEQRKVSSLLPKPTTPKPTSIEYTVQVAAYKTVDEAERHSQKLIDKGFPAFPVKTLIKDQTWYRVSIGSFKNRKQAVKYQRDLKKQAMVKTSFVRKIKRQ